MQNDFYTYELAYPESMGASVFYVGKGKGKRIGFHEMEAAQGVKSRKCSIIRKVWQNGEQIVKRKVCEGMTEQAAYRLECELISFYGRDTLSNETDGGEGGYRENAGRPHEHHWYLLVQWIDRDGKQDIEFCGPMLNRNNTPNQTIANEAERVAAYHVAGLAQSVKIVKRLCCATDVPDVIKLIKE